ncbi:hypothetical protein FQN60_002787 [Etheostoma spectabile]|uniref:Uncharacterized protein n=1 Tax=Etheostoma spectabile TaxID=54343 RepID=A0A5J5CKV1_9PERO|nr:hypothetical protein FQN60_002787 [Etheostoma spectabile]
MCACCVAIGGVVSQQRQHRAQSAERRPTTAYASTIPTQPENQARDASSLQRNSILTEQEIREMERRVEQVGSCASEQSRSIDSRIQRLATAAGTNIGYCMSCKDRILHLFVYLVLVEALDAQRQPLARDSQPPEA